MPSIETLKDKVIHGDCLEILRRATPESVDAIVCDPPYELGFMGKKWDNTGIAYNVELWQECLRVLKPGGHLLAFGGTRTYHRMAVAIEDAGFEVRDMLEWIYASGFPKSLNVGKAVDKNKNKLTELKNFTKWFDDICKEKNITNKQLDEYLGLNSGGATCSHYRGWNTEQPRYPREAHFKKLKEWLGFGDLWDEKISEIEREVIGKDKNWGEMSESAKFTGGQEWNITKGSSVWEGFGTALKPAHEPIIMARKPLSENTIVENVLKHGTGAIDIDGCRIPTSEEIEQGRQNRKSKSTFQASEVTGEDTIITTQGRFPANCICTDDALNDNQITKSGWANTDTQKSNSMFLGEMNNTGNHYGDSGSKSRYFDIDVWAEKHGLLQFPKASKKDRGEGNSHATVKPTHLMAYLVKLVSKEGDTVLDPFAGSGTTGVACKQLNRRFIGIEREQEYINIINARLSCPQ